ncbi:MAG: tetratricopeptide repeat protein, partial [Promethearchaeota archaeon]
MSIKDKITLLKKQLKGNLNKKIKLILNSGKEEIGIIERIHDSYIIFNTNHGKLTILDFDAWEIMKTEKDRVLNNKTSKIVKKFNETKFIRNLNLKPPDFTFPNYFNSKSVKEKKEIKKYWDKFVNQYHHLHKTKNFSQLLSLANDFIDLSQKYPNVSQIHYNCGCILYESGITQYDKALNFLERAFELEKFPTYAFNIACASINLNLDLKTHEMLSFYFHSKTPSQDVEAWYLYCHLSNFLGKFESYLSIFDSILEVEKKNEDFNLLIESILYFLHIKDFTEKFNIGIEFLTSEFNYDKLKVYIKDSITLLMKSYKRGKKEPFKKPLSKILEDPSKKYEKGFIFSYKRERNFGFLRKNNTTYFFHRSAIIDSILLKTLNNQTISKRNQIPVLFEKTIGQKGFAAINVSLFRSNDENYNIAIQLAEEGKYMQAINIMKIVLNNNPNYPNAMKYFEKWRAFSRYQEIPSGSNPYARAKRAEILDEDFLQAENFYKEAIKNDDNAEKAIKDLVNLLERLERPLDAIDILKYNVDKIKNRKYYEQQLLSLYQKTNQYQLLIDFLYKKYESSKNKFIRLRVLNQIGNIYLQQKNYKNAFEIFKELTYSDIDNIDAKKKLAISLINLKKLDEAEKLLKKITDTTLDNETIRIIEALREAKISGKPLQDDLLAIEIKLTDFYGEISKFTKFFLELCDYSGVNPEFIKVDDDGKKIFIGNRDNSKSEINKLKQIAKSFGTTRPLERSKNYLSAAKIAYEIEEDPYQFFRYLGRSFGSKGDSVILENGNLDAARAWYSEALSIYDHVRLYEKYERDAENALNMFIYSFLGQSRVPKPSVTIPQISASLYEVLGVYPEKEKLFDYLNYLILYSKYAGIQILHALNETETLKNLAVEYLKQKFPEKVEGSSDPIDIIHIWNYVQQDTFQKLHNITSEFQTLMHFELTSVWLEDAVEKLKRLSNKLLFELDRQHLLKIQTILSNSLEL